MQKCIVYSLLFFIYYNMAQAELKEQRWNVSKGTHFIIYYYNAPEDFVGKLADKAEQYYNKIADNLGFRRFNFWLWDNRAKIYIYDDQKQYIQATGQPAWSAGCAQVSSKVIHTFPYAAGFLDTVLPHEMGHIIFRELVGFNNDAIPLWLDEGVASYQENLKISLADRLVKEAINKGFFLSLPELSRATPQLMTDSAAVSLFYAEAISIIDYLIREFGTDKFILFCQYLRDSKDLTQAIASSYPFSNLKELDAAWQKYLQRH